MDNLNDTLAVRYRTLEQSYNDMQKNFTVRENEWKKDRALLVQQLDIQQIEINESKQREQNLKKMNETFLISISTENPVKESQSRFLKDFQRSIEANSRESMESKSKLQEHVQRMECRVPFHSKPQVRELEERLHEKELNLKDLENQSDKQLMQLQSQIVEAKSREDVNEQKIQKLQADARYRKDLNQFENLAALRDLQQQLVTMKGEHKKEVDRMRASHEAEMKKVKCQYAIKKSADDSFTKPKAEPKPTDLEVKFKEERKRLKSQIMSQEMTIKQYKEKVERLTKQIQEADNQHCEIRGLHVQLNNLVRDNNLLSQRIAEQQELESQLKCQIVELTTQLDEERLVNERMQQQRMQETASLGLKFSQDFQSKSKEMQSPCHPTARMRQMQQSNGVAEYSQLTLNPQVKATTQSKKVAADGKENMPDVSQFSTNPGSFKVQDLIQNAKIGEQSPTNNREQELQSQLQHMLSKLYQAKKLITSNEENPYIRTSVQKLRQARSRNHSISVNEQLSELNILKDLEQPQYHTHYQSFLDDSMELRRPSQTTNSFSICQFEENQPSRLKIAQQPLHSYFQKTRYQQAKP